MTIKKLWKEYQDAVELLELAEKNVEDALIALKKEGTQFEIDGEIKQVRSRKRRGDGKVFYYLVNLGKAPARTASMSEEDMKRLEDQIRERLKESVRKELLAELGENFQRAAKADETSEVPEQETPVTDLVIG